MGTQAKTAPQWEVRKDLFHVLREHWLPGCSCPHVPVPLPPRWEERTRGRQEGEQARAPGGVPSRALSTGWVQGPPPGQRSPELSSGGCGAQG